MKEMKLMREKHMERSNPPGRLPERLSILFPIWFLMDTPPGGAYRDIDRCVRETAERGFNCIRCESGAGLIFDRDGKPRGPVSLSLPFAGHTRGIRQMDSIGGGGECDLLERLFELFEAAKRHDVYVILSSWYFLHTFWFCDEAVNRELFAIPPHERHMRFAEFLDRILVELEQRGYAGRIAFAEVFNEADALPFVGGYGESSPETRTGYSRFREEHSKALSFLRARHPGLLFGYDTFTPCTRPELFPENAQVWNFHAYWLWSIYRVLEGRYVFDGEDSGAALRFLRAGSATLDDVIRDCGGKPAASPDWYRRVQFYGNLDQARLPEMERLLEQRLLENLEHYKQNISDSMDRVLEFRKTHCPGVPLVMGEGVTYCGSTRLLWEERSERYWNLLEYAVKEYRRAGLWGCVLRTCCGPEDPSWHLVPEKLMKLNRIFQEGEV